MLQKLKWHISLLHRPCWVKVNIYSLKKIWWGIEICYCLHCNNSRKKVVNDNVRKILKLFYDFDHPVCSKSNKVSHQIFLRKVIIITSCKFTTGCFQRFIFHKIFSVCYSVVTKVYFFFNVTPYIFFTHPVFLRLY